MAKKKGKKGKKGKKAKGGDGGGGGAAAADDGANDELTLLRRECKGLKKNIKKEEMDFNEFQQQREKLNYFWIVEKKDLEDKKAEHRNKERELQDLDEKHQVEIKVYKQRVKHLLHEHQNEVTHLKTDAEMALKLAQDQNAGAESELKKDKRDLKLDLKEMELSHEDYLKSLKQEQDRNITLLRQEFERKAKELQLKYEKKMKNVRDTLEARRKQEIQRIEHRKDSHINELMKAHEKAFGEIKNYYNDITHNNLDLIKSLKEEVAEMKKKESADEKLMFEIAQENKRMSEPLKQALQDVQRLREELGEYNRDRATLSSTKARLLVVEDKLKGLRWEHEVLLQRYEMVHAERDELYQRFQRTIYDVQQKSGFRNLLLERKLEAVAGELERQDAQLNEVLVSARLEPSVLGQVRTTLEDFVEAKNTKVRRLQAELQGLVEQHNDVIRAYDGKLEEYGIPVEELGFRPKFIRMSDVDVQAEGAQ